MTDDAAWLRAMHIKPEPIPEPRHNPILDFDSEKETVTVSLVDWVAANVARDSFALACEHWIARAQEQHRAAVCLRRVAWCAVAVMVLDGVLRWML